MMWSMVRYIAAMLALVGCAQGNVLPGYLDDPAPSVTFHNQTSDASLVAHVENAAARWNAATCLDIRLDGLGVVWRMQPGLTYQGEQVLGLTSPSPLQPELVEVSTESTKVSYTVTHEMGHTLGINHVDATEVMNARSIVGAGFITSASIEAVCAIQDCGCFNPER